MPREVIMPALGMSQDAGVIVAWHKAPGDPVAIGDVLLEVETDKATMEVEADRDGYVAEIRFPDGAEVPVGDVIARITEERPDAPTGPGEGTAPASTAAVNATGGKGEQTADPAVTTGAPATTAPPAPAPATQTPGGARPIALAPAADGRLLASPKARRLAEEEGLDLTLLVRTGVPQPYHVSDLDQARALAAQHDQTDVAGAGQVQRLVARVGSAGLEAFVGWAATEIGDAVDRRALLACFAAASWRSTRVEDPAAEPEDDMAAPLVRTWAPLIGAFTYTAADRTPVAQLVPSGADGRPTVIVRDLITTPLTRVELGGEDAPAFTLMADGQDLIVQLEAPASALPAEAAMTLLAQFAGRLQAPLRHLL